MRNLSLGRRHLVNAHEVKTGISVIAGKTVRVIHAWAQLRVIQKWALYKYTYIYLFFVCVSVCNQHRISHRCVNDILVEPSPLFDVTLFQMVVISNSGIYASLAKRFAAAQSTPRSRPGWELRSRESGGFSGKIKSGVFADKIWAVYRLMSRCVVLTKPEELSAHVLIGRRCSTEQDIVVIARLSRSRGVSVRLSVCPYTVVMCENWWPQY